MSSAPPEDKESPKRSSWTEKLGWALLIASILVGMGLTIFAPT